MLRVHSAERTESKSKLLGQRTIFRCWCAAQTHKNSGCVWLWIVFCIIVFLS